MVALLKKEQQDDDDKKEMCEMQRDKAEDDLKVLRRCARCSSTRLRMT